MRASTRIPGFRNVGTTFEPAFVTEDGSVRIRQVTPRKWAVYGAGGTRFHKEVEGREAAVKEAQRLAADMAAEHVRGLDTAKSRLSARQHATKKPTAQLDREIAEALGGSKHTGKQLSQAAKRANDQIYDLINNKYFQAIPNDQLFQIVKSVGFRFDPEEEEFILVGRDGNATWQLHDASGRPVNHLFVLQWHKMDRTGRYEVVAYVS